MRLDTQASSNVLREATNMGYKVTSSNTFLKFDTGNDDDQKPGESRSHGTVRRRFTTNGVLTQEVAERLQDLSAFPTSSIVEQPEESVLCDDGPLLHESKENFEAIRKCESFSEPCMSASQAQSEAASRVQEDYADTSAYTTVMIRHVPNRFSQDELVNFLKKCHFKFDFFYCPMDFRNKCNIGYFFINLPSPQAAMDFMAQFEGYQLPAYRSTKVCAASWARIQGFDQNVAHYLNSPVARMGREFRPRIFDADGRESTFPVASMPCAESFELQFRKVFVGGLAPTSTAETLQAHLSRFGDIEDVSIILDSISRMSRGFAFVTFANPNSVQVCVAAKQLHFIDGRSVGIRPYTSASPV